MDNTAVTSGLVLLDDVHCIDSHLYCVFFRSIALSLASTGGCEWW